MTPFRYQKLISALGQMILSMNFGAIEQTEMILIDTNWKMILSFLYESN